MAMPARASLALSVAALLLAAAQAQRLPSLSTCPPIFYRSTRTMPVAEGKFMPIITNGVGPKAAKQAVIVIHGALRDGETYMFLADRATVGAGRREETAIIAPVFFRSACSAGWWTTSLWAKGDAVLWSKSTRQWSFGGESDAPLSISSYAILDMVLEWTQKEYPNIEKVVMAGFSAGAMMLQRWSILSPEGVDGKSRRGLPLRVILGSPSSYAFLSNKRPALECVPDRNTGTELECAKFEVPRKGKDTVKTCNGAFNEYPFGLGGLRPGSARKGSIRAGASAYANANIKNASRLPAELRERFFTKDVRLLLGTSDTQSCNVGVCSNDCAAMTTGANRLQRGLNFIAQLEELNPNYEAKFSFYKGGHNAIPAYWGHDFANWIFDHRTVDDGTIHIVGSRTCAPWAGAIPALAYRDTAEDCKGECLATPTCAAVTWFPGYGDGCYMFPSCDTTDANWVYKGEVYVKTEVACDFNTPVIIRGFHSLDLQDDNGTVRTWGSDEERADQERAGDDSTVRWRLQDAGNGNVVIASSRQESLEDHGGLIRMFSRRRSVFKAERHQWRITYAGEGRVRINSPRRQSLRDASWSFSAQGTVELGKGEDQAAEWEIIRARDGRPACRPAAAAAVAPGRPGKAPGAGTRAPGRRPSGAAFLGLAESRM